MNPYQYCSPRAEELPENFVRDIISILNYKQEHIKYFKKNNIDASYKEEELKIIIRFLDELDLHACYDIIGYRDTYHFPSWEDCEDWEDWVWQCADYE